MVEFLKKRLDKNVRFCSTFLTPETTEKGTYFYIVIPVQIKQWQIFVKLNYWRHQRAIRGALRPQNLLIVEPRFSFRNIDQDNLKPPRGIAAV